MPHESPRRRIVGHEHVADEHQQAVPHVVLVGELRFPEAPGRRRERAHRPVRAVVCDLV